jgi:hypothetical protein
MVTRKSLAVLTAVTLVLLATSGLIGKGRHGVVQAVAFASWWGFVLCAVLLVAASVATLIHHRRRITRT